MATRSKKQMARRIKSTVTQDNEQSSETQVTANIEALSSLNSVASTIEQFALDEKNGIAELIEAMKKIPESTHEQIENEKKLFDGLVKVVVQLKEKAGKETNTETKEKIETIVQTLSKRGDIAGKTVQQQSQDTNVPKNLKEAIGMKMGYEPQMIREKGFLKTAGSMLKKDVKSIVYGNSAYDEQSEGPDFSKKVSQAESLNEASSNLPKLEPKSRRKIKNDDTLEESSLRKKTTDNAKGNAALTKVLTSILTETTVIRKLVEGRIKYNPKQGQYKDAASGKNVAKEDLRRAGQGLYTKDEINEEKNLKLSKSQLKKISISDLEKREEISESSDIAKPVKNPRKKAKSVTQGIVNTAPRTAEEKARLLMSGARPTDTPPGTAEAKAEEKARLLMSRARPTDTPPGTAEAKPVKPIDEEKFKSSGTDVTEATTLGPDKKTDVAQKGGTESGGMGSKVMDWAMSKAKNKIFGKVGEKGVAKVGQKAAVKAGEKAAVKAGQKGVVKAAGKVGAKAIGKSVLKKLPLIGLAAGIGFGLQRALKGDMVGALGEVASGAASTIPGIGTAASVAIDAGLAAKDIKDATKEGEEPTTEGSAEPGKAASMPAQASAVPAGVPAAAAQNLNKGRTADQVASRVETAKRKSGPAIERRVAPVAEPTQNVVNNTTNNYGGGGKGGSQDQRPIPEVRPTDNSFIRFQNKRSARVV